MTAAIVASASRPSATACFTRVLPKRDQREEISGLHVYLSVCQCDCTNAVGCETKAGKIEVRERKQKWGVNVGKAMPGAVRVKLPALA